jgi:CheY-like chemotaxis protein
MEMSSRREQKDLKGRLHVLLVEDHTLSAELMKRLLESRDFSVRTVGSYREAMRMASQWLPDVLISDVGLPDRDGVEVITTMRRAHPNLRGIAVSGYATEEDVQRSLRAGFSDHLCKPVSIERLVEAINGLFMPSGGAEDDGEWNPDAE